VTTGLPDVLKLLARDSSCDGIMGFGAFHPRQFPVSLEMYLTSIPGASPVRSRLGQLGRALPFIFAFRRRAPRARAYRDCARMGEYAGKIRRRNRDRRRSSGRECRDDY
jgi:hypothetical protein